MKKEHLENVFKLYLRRDPHSFIMFGSGPECDDGGSETLSLYRYIFVENLTGGAEKSTVSKACAYGILYINIH
jgi:hypothetical protein